MRVLFHHPDDKPVHKPADYLVDEIRENKYVPSGKWYILDSNYVYTDPGLNDLLKGYQ